MLFYYHFKKKKHFSVICLFEKNVYVIFYKHWNAFIFNVKFMLFLMLNVEWSTSKLMYTRHWTRK